jgi:dienelactone hydrolase
MISIQEPALAEYLEEAVVFGADGNLVGVHCSPELSGKDKGFAALMITPGMLPSSGPFRLHVDLAHRLAAIGISSMRFDLSGIGESLAVGTLGSSLDRAASEISAAIDFIGEEYGVDRVALFGLCSGADDALYAAQKDSRIVGLFSVDGLGYRTSRYQWHRITTNYLPKLASKRAWKNRFNRLWAQSEVVPDTLRAGTDIREFPDRITASQQLAGLVNRGAALHFHYTGGVTDYYNHEHQFREMFEGTELSANGLIDRITTSFHRDSDHVSFLIEHRDSLVEAATYWFARVAQGNASDC